MSSQTERARIQLRAENVPRSLTLREQEIVALVIAGLSNKAIARHLGLLEGTVKVHLHQVYRKLGLKNRTALAAAFITRFSGHTEQSGEEHLSRATHATTCANTRTDDLTAYSLEHMIRT